MIERDHHATIFRAAHVMRHPRARTWVDAAVVDRDEHKVTHSDS